jgi:hypothetical protein
LTALGITKVETDSLDFILVHFLNDRADCLIEVSELVGSVALLHCVNFLGNLVLDCAKYLGNLVVLFRVFRFVLDVFVVAVRTHVLHLWPRQLVLAKVASVGDIHGLYFEDVTDTDLLSLFLFLCLLRLS